VSRFAALFDYAEAVLAFGFRDAAPAAASPAPEPDALERMAGRARAAWERSGRPRLVLLGLGSCALAAALAQALPAESLCVCELEPPLAQALRAAGRLAWLRREGGAGLAVDASPWALLFLLDRAGFTPVETLVLPNPELPPRDKARYRQLELLLVRSRPAEIPAAAPVPRLSCAAILAPGEPDLEGFFAQFPDWIAELVLVWDADAPPEAALPARIPARQLARRLGGDFSAQRMAMLAACRGDWVLYLDADERLSPAAWAALPRLCAAPEVAGWHLSRLSPYPVAERAVIGYGLWPDIQLRLFRNQPDLRFVNPVHERLVGLHGAQGLALDLEIEHLSRLRKDAAAIRGKLSGFDAASGGGLHHVLSAEYPSLPRELLVPAGVRGPRGLVLPPERV
jgi:hypothetical protein